ncbi:MAG: hypothetical protein ACO3QP_07135, partial [Burkholderiaceae bacterium]
KLRSLLTLVGIIAGVAATDYGWGPFFLSTFAAALPGLIMLAWLRPVIDRADQPPLPSSAGQ